MNTDARAPVRRPGASIRRIAVPMVAVLAVATVYVVSTNRSASATTTATAASATPTATAAAPTATATATASAAAAVLMTAAASTRATTASVPDLIKIMPLGDSITMGGGSPTFNGYRVDLAKRLAATGLHVDFVGSQRNGVGPDTNHEGHSHWTIQDIEARVDSWLAIYQPDVILLNIGTNNTANTADAEWAPSALSALLDRLQADRPTADIFVTKITSTKNPARQLIIDAYNAVVPEIVAEKGPKVHLVDQSTVSGRDLRDNIHPNDFGYAKMSYNWYNALEPVLGPHAVRWPAGVNPYTATKAYLCAALNPFRYVSGSDCRWWYLQASTWQTVRTVMQPYRAIVPRYYRLTVVAGKAVRVPVPAHWATRSRPVSVWVAN